MLLCAEAWIHCPDVGLRGRSHGHRKASTGGAVLERQCRQGELCVGDARACCDQSSLHFLCELEVWQEGWVRGMVILEVGCVGGGL